MKKHAGIFYISIITISISTFGIIKYLDKINLYKVNTYEIKGNNFGYSWMKKNKKLLEHVLLKL